MNSIYENFVYNNTLISNCIYSSRKQSWKASKNVNLNPIEISHFNLVPQLVDMCSEAEEDSVRRWPRFHPTPREEE